MTLSLSRPQRLGATAVAIAALASVSFQFAADWITLGDQATVTAVLWRLARYFTVLTNALVAVSFAIIAIRGRWSGAGYLAALTLWIVAVGAIFHALLAGSREFLGIAVWSNFGMHTLVPIMTLGLWLWAAPKSPLKFWHPIVWTAYPLAYAIYALTRGLIDGRFPYFFLDPERIGWPMVIAFILGIGAFFLVSGLAMVLLARFLNRAKQQDLSA